MYTIFYIFFTNLASFPVQSPDLHNPLYRQSCWTIIFSIEIKARSEFCIKDDQLIKTSLRTLHFIALNILEVLSTRKSWEVIVDI